MSENSEKELAEYLGKLESRTQETGVRAYLNTNAGVFQLGSIFEAETMKGHKNYIIFFFVRDHHVYYCHGDRAKKVREDRFLQLIDYGDLVPISRDKVDPERLSLSVLGLKAMSEGLAFNDYMAKIWGHGQGSQAP